MTLTAQPPQSTTPQRQTPIGRVIAGLRNAWRGLTSMRIALVLLFLLALAAIPGALIPQRSLNAQKVTQYIAARPTLGPWMNKLQLFDVFSSFWFTAIYALLFITRWRRHATSAGSRIITTRPPTEHPSSSRSGPAVS